jgi:hypothetical protein
VAAIRYLSPVAGALLQDGIDLALCSTLSVCSPFGRLRRDRIHDVGQDGGQTCACCGLCCSACASAHHLIAEEEVVSQVEDLPMRSTAISRAEN